MMKNLKKVHVPTLVCAVLMLMAMVLIPAGETHAAAYPGWGVKLVNGGERYTYPSPDAEQIKIWGYTNGGSSGNTLVNGTLNSLKTTVYSATAYLDTNLWSDVNFFVNSSIYRADEVNLAVSTEQIPHPAGTGADATARCCTELNAFFARGYHAVTSSYYGYFYGRTCGHFR